MENKYCTCGKYYHPTEFDKGLYPKCDYRSDSTWLCDNVDNTIYDKVYTLVLRGDESFHNSIGILINTAIKENQKHAI